MAKTYRDMSKINELAVELEKELLKFQQWMIDDIKYQDFLYQHDVIIGGYIDEFGEDASEQVTQSDYDEMYEASQRYEQQYHPELKIIGRILPLIKELTPIEKDVR